MRHQPSRRLRSLRRSSLDGDQEPHLQAGQGVRRRCSRCSTWTMACVSLDISSKSRRDSLERRADFVFFLRFVRTLQLQLEPQFQLGRCWSWRNGNEGVRVGVGQARVSQDLSFFSLLTRSLTFVSPSSAFSDSSGSSSLFVLALILYFHLLGADLFVFSLFVSLSLEVFTPTPTSPTSSLPRSLRRE